MIYFIAISLNQLNVIKCGTQKSGILCLRAGFTMQTVWFQCEDEDYELCAGFDSHRPVDVH